MSSLLGAFDFSYQGRSTSPHFDTKARGNSEMAYYLGLTRTILLHYPISTEIRTVDSQSDLRIFLIVMIKGGTKCCRWQNWIRTIFIRLHCYYKPVLGD